NAETQLFSWTPGFGQAGMYNLRVVARNPAGIEATTAALVQILHVNRPPIFVPPAARQVIAGNEIRVSVLAADPDSGDVLTFVAANLPTGATFDGATGTLVWRPGGVQAGRYDIPITVSDGRLSVTQVLPIVVNTQPQLPKVRLDLTPSFAAVSGSAVIVQVTAEGIAPITSIQVLVDGVAQALDQFGRVTVHPVNPGQVNVVARATDADGFTGEGTTILKVRDPADREAPVISIDVPPTNTVLSAPVTVRGSVADANLGFWRVELRPLGFDSAVILGSGTAPIAGDLGVIDTRRLENGPYLLSLIAQDISGRTTRIERVVEVNSTDKGAAFVRTETDVSATLAGLTIPIVRRYSSLNATQDSLFGLGWQFVLAEARFAANVPATGREADGIYSAFTRNTRVYVTLPNGERTSLSFTPQAVTVGGLTYYQPAWTATAAGTTFTLSSGTALLEDRGGAFYQVGTGLPYNPASGRFGTFDYALTAADGTRYSYTVAAGLRELTGANGVTLVWTDAGFTAANGDRLPVEKDSSSRIARVVAPNGDSAIYSYSATGSLLQVTRLEAGRRTWLGYRADGGRLLTEVAGDNAVSVRYDSTGAVAGVDPIRAVLGTSSQFLGASPSGALSAGATDLYAIVLGATELASSANGLVTLGFEVTGSGGFNPAPAGLRGAAPVYTSTGPGHSLALYTLRSPGPLAIEIAGADAATSGSYGVRIFFAGDVNGDAAIDGNDETLFNAAFGAATGQPAYNAAADFNGDGRVDAADRAYLQAGFGFVAVRAPTVSDKTLTTAGGVRVAIDLSSLAIDPQGSKLFFTISSVTGGTIRLLDGTRTAVFTPTSGFTGTGGFDVRADNLSLGSSPARVTVEMLTTPLANLRFSAANAPNLKPGEIKQLFILGDLPDGRTLTLEAAQFAVSTSDGAVLRAAPDGSILGIAKGSAIVVFDLGGGRQIATAVTVDGTDARQLEFFPEAYALTAGGTRQFLVKERLENDYVDRSSTADGTRYFTSDPGLATISADGLLTAVANGEVTVTVVNGGLSAQVRVRISNPLASGSMVGTRGGVITGDGITVGIPAGALPSDRPVTVAALPSSAAPFAGPDGFEVQNGVRIDWGSGTPGGPYSLAMPAPAGSAPGQVVYLMAPMTVRLGFGEADSTGWLMLDTMVVGSDGTMRTTSPPNLGIAAQQQYATALNRYFIQALGVSAFAITATLGGGPVGVGTALLLTSQAATLGGLATVEYRLAAGFGRGKSIYAFANRQGVVTAPLISSKTYSAVVRLAAPQGLRVVSTLNGVQVDPNQTLKTSVVLPPILLQQEVEAPRITSASFDFASFSTNPTNLTPRVILNGADFLLSNPYLGASSLGSSLFDLYVTFEIGGRDSINPDGTPNYLGGPDIIVPGTSLILQGTDTLWIPVPPGAQIAGATITVTRPMMLPRDGTFERQEFTSNGVQLVPQTRYVFVANGGDGSVSVLDGLATADVTPVTNGTPGATLTKFDPREVARIDLADPAKGAPRNIAVTYDGTRAYVTFAGTNKIAVIDAIALQQIDVDSRVTAPGIQSIALPPGAQLWDVAIERGGRYLYASDAVHGVIYVVNIDPLSTGYDREVLMVPVGPAPLGLRGLALNNDDSRLYVTAPGRTLFGQYGAATGRVFVIDTNVATRDKPAFLNIPTNSLQVGPEPYDITGTDDP
ncbi:MAG: putative Ig domain-containing protein, partial [Verrucomicrobiota bacterium]